MAGPGRMRPSTSAAPRHRPGHLRSSWRGLGCGSALRLRTNATAEDFFRAHFASASTQRPPFHWLPQPHDLTRNNAQVPYILQYKLHPDNCRIDTASAINALPVAVNPQTPRSPPELISRRRSCCIQLQLAAPDALPLRRYALYESTRDHPRRGVEKSNGFAARPNLTRPGFVRCSGPPPCQWMTAPKAVRRVE